MTAPTMYEMLERAGADLGEEHLYLNKTKLPYAPYDTQVEGVSAFMNEGTFRYGLWDDPGTGKTLVAIALMSYYATYGNKFIILMPPILLEQLEKTMETCGTDMMSRYSIHYMRQSPEKRSKLYEEWNKSGWPAGLAMSYEMFTRLTSPIVQKKDPRTGRRPKALPAQLPIAKLHAEGYNFIIPDEAHYLGNVGTKTARRVKEFIYGHPDKPLSDPNAALLMTGTPLRGKVEDVYGLISLLTPDAYGSHACFVRAHCLQVETRFGKKTVGYNNYSHLNKNLYAQARRAEAREVLKNMQEPLAIEWPLTLEPAHKRLYKKMVNEQLLVLGEQILDLTSEQRLRQALMRVVTCPHLFQAEDEKPIRSVVYDAIDEYMNIIDVTNKERKQNKFIIFCWFQETCEAVANYLKHWRDADGNVHDLQPLVINGATPKAQRSTILERYHDDPSNRGLILNFISGGAGLDLQDQAYDMLCIEPTGLPHHYRQAIARVARGGQTQQCVMRIVTVKGTVFPVQYRNFIKREGEIQEVARDKHDLFKLLNGE